VLVISVTRTKNPSLLSSRNDSQEDQTLGDQALVTAIAHQEQEAFERLYDRYHTMVYYLARKILNTPDRAEEVVYDVFWQVWREAERYDRQRGSVGAWLTTLTRSRAIDALRVRKVQPSTIDDTGLDERHILPDSAPNPEERTSLGQRAVLVRAAMETLPTEQRTALELAFFSGLSHSEIAEHLDEPIGTIKTRIRSAMLRLRDCLRPLLGGSS
jgi:RNA polymerase sigma-70 factor, ECF subfamily